MKNLRTNIKAIITPKNLDRSLLSRSMKIKPKEIIFLDNVGQIVHYLTYRSLKSFLEGVILPEDKAETLTKMDNNYRNLDYNLKDKYRRNIKRILIDISKQIKEETEKSKDLEKTLDSTIFMTAAAGKQVTNRMRQLNRLLKFAAAKSGNQCIFCKKPLITPSLLQGQNVWDTRVPVSEYMNLTWHHLDNNRTHNTATNLVMVHSNCHKSFHMSDNRVWEAGGMSKVKGVLDSILMKVINQLEKITIDEVKVKKSGDYKLVEMTVRVPRTKADFEKLVEEPDGFTVKPHKSKKQTKIINFKLKTDLTSAEVKKLIGILTEKKF